MTTNPVLNSMRYDTDGNPIIERRVGTATVIDPNITLHMRGSDVGTVVEGLRLLIERDPAAAVETGVVGLHDEIASVVVQQAAALRDRDRMRRMDPCRHEESMHGRCTRCGQTWEQQAANR